MASPSCRPGRSWRRGTGPSTRPARRPGCSRRAGRRPLVVLLGALAARAPHACVLALLDHAGLGRLALARTPPST
eukprot:6655000-Heterocapsa_arctica.AAC.1